MRKMFILIQLVIIACLPIYSDIEKCNNKLDQVAPLSQNPGRVVKLKKVMTISDEQGGFFFRMPQDLKIAPGGSIYLKDYYQLLRFDQKGKLLNNYHRKGQGPGEFGFNFNYIIHKDDLIVFCMIPNKIIWFDQKGPVKQEFRPKQLTYGKLVLYRNNHYYYFSSGIPLVKGKPKIIDVNHSLIEYSKEGEKKKLISFPVKKYVMSRGEERRSYQLGNFIVKVYQDKYLVVSHTPSYLVSTYNIEENSIVNSFSRKYQRQAWKDKKWERDKLAPKIEFAPDIENLLIYEDKIMVVTSINCPGKGRLIDIFDIEGNYLDNFYINIKGEILDSHEKYLFVLEEGEYGNPFITKYEIASK